MSCDNLLTKWLAFYDPIHRGFTPRGIANGGMTTVGWSFPRIRGGFNLYRGAPSGNDIDFTDPVGAAGFDADEIRNFAWRNHSPGTTYYYALKSINGGGCESAPAERIWPATFDEAGNMLGDPPNAPDNLQVEPASGGRFRLRWTYSERDQLVAPSEFRLYHDNGSGTVDYETIVATVSYKFARFHYEYTSGGFAHDAKRVWSVRAASAAGIEDANTTAVVAVADAVGPPNHPTAFTECGPEV